MTLDDFAFDIEVPTDRHTLQNFIDECRKYADCLSRNENISLILKLAILARHYISEDAADTLINECIGEVKNTASEVFSLLMSEKGFSCFKRSLNRQAAEYADKALSVARSVHSPEAESRAMILKGYLEDIQAQHNKATAWYFMALEKCPYSHISGLLMDIGTSLSKQGEYAGAWKFMKRALWMAEKILEAPPSSVLDKVRQSRVRIDALSRMGSLYESVGDYENALESHDIAFRSAALEDFADLIYKTSSRKMKLMLILSRHDEAACCLLGAELFLKEWVRHDEPRFFLFLANDWARLLRSKKNYAGAIDRYREILYGSHEYLPAGSDRFDYVIMWQADLFGEVLSGMVDCLFFTGRARLSEALDEAGLRYREYIKKFGIYAEFDKIHEMQFLRNRIKALVNHIFDIEPSKIEYKDITLAYDPAEQKKAVLFRGEKKLHLAPRNYYVIKCLMRNIGECVTEMQIVDYLQRHGESMGGTDGSDSGVREYIAKLRNKYGFVSYIVTCPKGMGYKLIP